jgi:hypothetical protein
VWQQLLRLDEDALSLRPEAVVLETTLLTEDFVLTQVNPFGYVQNSQFGTLTLATRSDATGLVIEQGTALWDQGVVRLSGRVTPDLRLEDAKVDLMVGASLFRQDTAANVLIRLTPTAANAIMSTCRSGRRSSRGVSFSSSSRFSIWPRAAWPGWKL